MHNIEVGDKVRLNSRYFVEGGNFFGKTLKYPRDKQHFFIVKNINQKTTPPVVTVDGGSYKEIEYIADVFLEKI